MQAVLKKNPVEKEYTFFEQWSFSWLNSTLKLGNQKPLEIQDIPELPRDCRVEHYESRLQNEWDKERLHCHSIGAEVK
jgi:hypothetical protein